MDRLLEAILRRFVRRGTLRITTAHGHTFTVGDGSGPPIAIRFATAAAQRGVMLDPELKLGEAYMDGTLVMEQGTVSDLLHLSVYNLSNQSFVPFERLWDWLRRAVRQLFALNNLTRASHNAAHHYNIDYRIYRLFLDDDLQYSCAYFERPDASLDEAQMAKKRHIAGKLLLDEKPDLKVLDIGSGWGGLGMHLARNHQAQVTGINLSEEQVKVARERAKAENLSCEFRIQDYRNVAERFDRIVSVGMFEHVGKSFYNTFFRKCYDILADDGVMLLHTVGRWDKPSITNPWIWKYIFPGGYAPTLSEITPVIERSKFIIADVEVLRLHYAETLKHWRERFLAHRDEALRIFDERFARMWEFYLAGFEPCFRYGGLEVFQIQLIKRLDATPITRDYMYRRGRQPPSQVQVAEAAE